MRLLDKGSAEPLLLLGVIAAVRVVELVDGLEAGAPVGKVEVVAEVEDGLLVCPPQTFSGVPAQKTLQQESNKDHY